MAVEPGYPVNPAPAGIRRPPSPRRREQPAAAAYMEPPTDAQPAPTRRRWIRRERIGPAFWTISSVISLGVNLALLVVVITLSETPNSLGEALCGPAREGMCGLFFP